MTQKKIIFIQYYKTTIGEVIVGSYENQDMFIRLSVPKNAILKLTNEYKQL